MCADAARFVPRRSLSGRNNRSEGYVEALRAIVVLSFGAASFHQLLYRRARLSKERIDVAMFGPDVHCRIRGSAEVEWDVRVLHGAHRGERFADTIKAPLEIKGLLGSPDATQNGQILVRVFVALIMAEPIPIAALLSSRASRDEVQPQPTVGEHVERCRRARR